MKTGSNGCRICGIGDHGLLQRIALSASPCLESSPVGAMRIGWQQVDGAWYYFGSNGAMLHDTTVLISGIEQTFDSSGRRVG